MSTVQAAVTTLLADITSLETQLAAKRTELQSHREELKKLLGVVESGARTAQGAKPAGRPPGASSENVSQGVLKFMSEHALVGGTGVSRADLLKQFPGRDSAVQAAIRTHQLAGRIFNTTDHRWYYSDPQPVALAATAPAEVTA